MSSPVLHAEPHDLRQRTLVRDCVPGLDRVLSRVEQLAVRHFVVRVLEEVQATLVQASLFGSKARGRARPDSDVDVLLVFRDLSPDREPYASHAESIAGQVAELTGVPVTVWSVALPDLESGWRTPMLVDAIEDAFPVWCWPEPLPLIDFGVADALHCCAALLDRVSEGSAEYAHACAFGDRAAAARRARDDIVRLCTALLLLRGITRPRRAEVVRECVRLGLVDVAVETTAGYVLDWVRGSFGPDGRQDAAPVASPEVSGLELTDFVQRLIEQVESESDALQRQFMSLGTPAGIGV